MPQRRAHDIIGGDVLQRWLDEGKTVWTTSDPGQIGYIPGTPARGYHTPPPLVVYGGIAFAAWLLFFK